MPSSNPGPFGRFFSWLGGHDRSFLFTLTAILGGVWLFGELADQVTDGGLQSMDKALLLAFRRPGDLQPIGPAWLPEAVRDITALGGVFILSLVTLLTTAFLAMDGKRRLALFVLGAVGTGTLLSDLLKDVFQRPRPTIVPHLMPAQHSSFPSGHSMLSAVTYLTLGAMLAASAKKRSLKAYFLIVAGLLTFIVGVSRVFMGVHWPSDVMGGWTAGAVWALICRLALDRVRRPDDRGLTSADSPNEPVSGPANGNQEE